MSVYSGLNRSHAKAMVSKERVKPTTMAISAAHKLAHAPRKAPTSGINFNSRTIGVKIKYKPPQHSRIDATRINFVTKSSLCSIDLKYWLTVWAPSYA